VEETSRLTTNKIELSGEMKAKLDLTLSRIQYLLDTTTDRDNTPEVAITYFVKDVYKEGGEYVTISSRIRRIDPVDRVIVLQDKSTIPIDDVLQLKF
jgi:ABC-type protease/lipase transport system fused ATPase/permease subunit